MAKADQLLVGGAGGAGGGGAAALAEAWRHGSWDAAGRPATSLTRTFGRLVYLRSPPPPEQRLVDSAREVAFVASGASWARSIGLG